MHSTIAHVCTSSPPVVCHWANPSSHSLWLTSHYRSCDHPPLFMSLLFSLVIYPEFRYLNHVVDLTWLLLFSLLNTMYTGLCHGSTDLYFHPQFIKVIFPPCLRQYAFIYWSLEVRCHCILLEIWFAVQHRSTRKMEISLAIGLGQPGKYHWWLLGLIFVSVYKTRHWIMRSFSYLYDS